ncbi:Rieske (2Fe-2S) protein [Pseudonocardia saturnea]|jgi:nitrite reductase/ring-hydroxylating ferredoxin subunit|nr:Rieske (2Fe-2S) protein [Pseudonocardia oceani]
MTDITNRATGDHATDPSHGHTRRAALIGMGATCAAGLTGCAAGPAPTAASPPGTPVASTSDIPVGGGRIFGEYDLVVTQPSAGTWAAFSATCTHQSCTVATVDGGSIVCPCHGSKFAITDGAVTTGPATRPLPPKAITVTGTSITTA